MLNFNSMKLNITSALYGVMLFILFFSGNGVISVFFPVILLAYVFLFFMIIKRRGRISVTRKNIYFLLALIFVFFYLSPFLNYRLDYFLWVLNTIVCYFVLELIYKDYQDDKLNALYVYVIFSLLFFVFFIGISMSNSDRASFIFGPNILYRVSSVCFFSLLFLLYKNKFFIKLILLILFSAILLFTLLKIGSRGGVILSALVLFVGYMFLFGRDFNRTLISICLLLGLTTYVFANFDYLLKLLNDSGRLFQFNIDQSESLRLRVQPWYELLSTSFFLEYPIGMSYEEFFSKYGAPGFEYPHNLLLELMLFFGVPGLLFSIFLTIRFMKILKMLSSFNFNFSDFFVLTTVVVFLGSQFSGDLTDNYITISLLIFSYRMTHENK